MKLSILFLACAVALATASPTPAPAPAQEPAIAWNYAQGGSDWPGLCSTGKAQSPININTTAATCVRASEPDAKPFRLDFHYKPGHNLTLQNNGHALQVKGDLGFLTVGGCNPCDGQKYHVKQVNFHAPSEHSINTEPTKDGHYAMETHIVHQKEGSAGLNDLVTLVIMWYKQPAGGFSNSFLDSIDWANAPADTTRQTVISNKVRLSKLKEAFEGEYFSYFGSLPVPPCTEGVQYFVMKRPLGVTEQQLGTIQALYANNKSFANGRGNSRNVQPLNDRKVWYYRKHH